MPCPILTLRSKGIFPAFSKPREGISPFMLFRQLFSVLPLLALWVSQKELLEQNAAQQQKLLSEFQAALGKSQTAWSEQAKALAQQSLNAGLQAAQNSTALLLEEAARMNAAAVRKAFEEGVARMEQALAAGRRIAWLSLAASVVALTATLCVIFARVIH